MKLKVKLPIIVLMSTIALTGCQSMGEKETVGTVVGTVAGGVIGAQFGHGAGRIVGGAVGALLGGLFGNAVGDRMDAEDARQANLAFNRATRTPVGQTVYWNNTRTGNWGSYRATRDGHSQYEGYYCREFVTTATINKQTQRVYGTACRHPDGTWHAVR